jgi:transcriptional regulator with XRE-family HTH domain
MNGPELKQRREELGLTQTTFAEVLGITANTISRYERGSLQIPKWMELTLQALEQKHIETLQKRQRSEV